MTITQTVTQTFEATNSLVFLAKKPVEEMPGEKSLSTYMDALAGLYDKFCNGPDPLTRTLNKWVVSVIEIYRNESEISDDELERNLIERVNELKQKILVDPFYHRPIKIPVCVGGRVLEKSTLDDYLESVKDTPFAETSPFDSKPMDLKPEVHAYALAVITLVNSVLSTQTESKVAHENSLAEKAVVSLVGVGEKDPVTKVFKALWYRKQANQIVELERVRDQTNQLMNFNSMFKRVEKECREINRQHVEVAKMQAEKNKKEIESTIAGMQTAHGATVGVLTNKHEALERDNKKVKEGLASTQNELTVAMSQIDQLRANNNSLQRQVQELANKKDKGKCVVC